MKSSLHHPFRSLYRNHNFKIRNRESKRLQITHPSSKFQQWNNIEAKCSSPDLTTAWQQKFWGRSSSFATAIFFFSSILHFWTPEKSTWHLRAEMGPCKQALQPMWIYPRRWGKGLSSLGSMHARKNKKESCYWSGGETMSGVPLPFLMARALPLNFLEKSLHDLHARLLSTSNSVALHGCKTCRRRQLDESDLTTPGTDHSSRTMIGDPSSHLSKRSPYRLFSSLIHSLSSVTSVHGSSPSTGVFLICGVVHICS